MYNEFIAFLGLSNSSNTHKIVLLISVITLVVLIFRFFYTRLAGGFYDSIGPEKFYRDSEKYYRKQIKRKSKERKMHSST